MEGQSRQSELEDHLLRAVGDCQGQNGRILVVLPPRATCGLVTALRRSDAVVGVLGNQALVDAFAGDSRLFLAPQTDRWSSKLPRASILMVADSLAVVSWQWLLGARRSGVGSLMTLEPNGHWQATNMSWAFLTQVLVRGARKLFQKAAFGNGWFSRRWWESVGTFARKAGEAEASAAHEEKILLVTGSLAAGGAERQVVHLANYLAGAGVNVSVLVQRLVAEEDRFFLDDLSPTVRVFELPHMFEWETVGMGALPSSGSMTGFLDSMWMVMMLHPRFVDEVKRYRRFFLEQQPSVVHAWLDFTNVAAGLAAILAGVPRIFLGGRNLAPYRFTFSQPYFRPLYRMLLSFPNVTMLNNSRAGLVDYAWWLGIDEAHMRVVYNGIAGVSERPDDEEVVAWKEMVGLRCPQAPVIGGVFRFSPEKDPLCWVDVARSTLDRWPEGSCPPQFLMVGDGPLWDETVAYAKKQAIDIAFVRRESRIALAMCAMDVFLLTSRDEGTPNVLIEAQALGRPVVTTDAGGCPETVSDGLTGWVVKVGDRGGLAEKVISVLLDSVWRERASVCAPAFIESRFGNRRLVEKMSQLYGIECKSSD